MWNDNEYFTFYIDVFFPLSQPRLLPDLIVYMSTTAGVFLRSGKSLTFASNWIHAQFFVESMLLIFFVLCYYVSLRSEFRVMISVTISRQKDVRVCLQLFIGGIMSYLRCLWLLAYRGVQHILCCGFILHCVPCVANFSGLSIFEWPFRIL